MDGVRWVRLKGRPWVEDQVERKWERWSGCGGEEERNRGKV